MMIDNNNISVLLYDALEKLRVCLLQVLDVDNIFSTFLGAGLAFFFGWRLYKKQKREEDKTYLQYMASILASLSSHLYSFKEQVGQKRYNEYQEQMAYISKCQQDNQPIRIKIRETGNYMYGASFNLALNIERLSFLISRDPNLIVLVGTLINSINSLNHMASNINQDLEKYTHDSGSIDPNKAMLLLEKNKLLYEQLDSSIYLTDKCAGLLIQFGILEWGKEMKIKSIDLTDEKYKALKPKPIQSWEDGYKWFPEKKRWWTSR